MATKKKTRKKSDYSKLMSKYLKEEMTKISGTKKCVVVKDKQAVKNAFKKAAKRAKVENNLMKLRKKSGKKKTGKYSKI